VPLQVPSMEIFACATAAVDATGAADDATGAADDATSAADDTAGATDDFAGDEEIDAAGAEEIDSVHSPNLAWHPTPQCADVEPQYPSLEQQFPNTDLLQVRVLQDCVPQRAE
jgi:hypothetical protein